MTRTSTTLFASLLLAFAAVAPARGLAQAKATAAQSEALSAQEKEMLGVAQDFSRRVSETMEGWLAAKEVSEERLFSFLYYPTANTDPPKFTTDWDRISDRDIQGIEEAVMTRSGTLVYAVLVDKNGYLPTHNLRYSQPLTGNLANDLVNDPDEAHLQRQDRAGRGQEHDPLPGPALPAGHRRDHGRPLGPGLHPRIALGRRAPRVPLRRRALKNPGLADSRCGGIGQEGDLVPRPGPGDGRRLP